MANYGLCVLVPMLLVTACSSPSTSEPGAEVQCFNYDTCGYKSWPRVMVGVIPSASSTVDVTSAFHVSAAMDDGTTHVLERTNCLVVDPPLVCTFGYHATPNQRQVTLKITGPGQTRREIQAELGAFNYCGVDILYVPVIMDGDSTFEVGTPRLVSPCKNP